MRSILALVCVSLLLHPMTEARGEIATAMRSWKDASGNSTQAQLRGFDAGIVILTKADGKELRVPIQNLSPDDQRFVICKLPDLAGASPAVLASAPAAGKAASGAVAMLEASATWPPMVTVPEAFSKSFHMEKQSADRKHVYRSRRFEFIVFSGKPISAAVMQDAAKVFEGTCELLRQSPFGVQASPKDGLFRAELYEDRSGYHLAGGPQGSGGVYSGREKVFRVPFESLGLKIAFGAYTKDKDYQVKTLVHEITHMMMHDIVGMMPEWLAEGTAEYAETIPFKLGHFLPGGIHEAVKAYNKERIEKRIGSYSFKDMLPLNARQWQRAAKGEPLEEPPAVNTAGRVFVPAAVISGIQPNRPPPHIHKLYHSALLLTYYFMHLEGDGKGSRFVRYLQALRGDVAAWRNYQAEFEVYKAGIDEFLKHPEVKTLSDGRFQYPPYLTPPKAPVKPPVNAATSAFDFPHYQILLDGKSVEQVAKEAAAALEKAGLKLM